MIALEKLSGKTIAVLVADGFEQVELETSVRTLTKAGAKVTIVALRPGRVRGMHVHSQAIFVRVDKAVGIAQASDYDGLLIPGGYISPDLLRQSAQARDFVQQFDALGKPIALISQAPLLLISTTLAKSRTMTSWPGVRDDLVNAGAIWLNQEVVHDRNCLFGRGPQDIASFVREMIPFFPTSRALYHASANAVPILRGKCHPKPPPKPCAGWRHRRSTIVGTGRMRATRLPSRPIVLNE